MEEKQVLALGYPIGFNYKDDVEYYNVQLNDNVYPLNLLSAFIWMGALNGYQTKEKLFDNVIGQLQTKGYNLGKDYTVDNLEYIYSELVAAFLLIEVSCSKDLAEFFKKYTDLRIFRKGFGIGIDFEDIVVHEDGKNINLDSFEYYLWQLSAGSKTLKETYEEYRKSVFNSINELGGDANSLIGKVEKSFLTGFINLYNKNLIYIIGI